MTTPAFGASAPTPAAGGQIDDEDSHDDSETLNFLKPRKLLKRL